MRKVLYDVQGRPLRDLRQAEIASVEWAPGADGTASLVVPKDSALYKRSRRLWDPDGFTPKLVSLEWMDRGEKGAGLPPWAGLAVRPQDEVDRVVIGCLGAGAALAGMVFEEYLRLDGGPARAIEDALALCRTDSYPVRLGRIGLYDGRLGGLEPPQDLRTFVGERLARSLRWQWNVRPRVSRDGRLELLVDLREALGAGEEDVSPVLLGRTMLSSRSISSDAGEFCTCAVGLGTKSGNNDSMTVAVRELGPIDDGCTIARVFQYPDLFRREDVEHALDADLAKARQVVVQALAVTTDAGTPGVYSTLDFNRKLALGHSRIKDPVTLDSWGWDGREDRVVLHVRHRTQPQEVSVD